MGQHHGKQTEKDQKLLFSPESQDKLKEVFLDASIGDEKVCLVKGLQECLGRVLHSTIAARLCQQMHPDGAGKIDYQSYVFLTNALFKATLEQRSALVETLARGDSDHVDILDLRHYVEKMVLSYVSVLKLTKRPKMESLERLTTALLAEFSDKDASVPVTQSDIESWLLRCPLFAAIQTNVFRSAFNLDIPHDYRHILPDMPDIDKSYEPAIGPLERMFVNYALPQQQRDQWRLFFSNKIHGQSFSTMLGSIVDQGPSLVVIRDTDGHVFGAYAPESWHCNGEFYGTAQTFLYALDPKMEIFLPSGFNENYMYLNVNQQTLPNGMGFGGKFEYFGLFVSADFGHGFTAPTCTTFESRQLSGKKRFQIDVIEVWGVGPKPKKVDDDSPPPRRAAAKPSILDADPEGAAMVEMVKGGMHSEGLRETPTSDIPAEKELPPM
ncbi:MTOR-associated protein MEAK7-like isoform X1 [Amphibalanus amphitrite]|uniref:MTOR-associated protein MEAK7-like isoform X1 n=1 Tax=Amphibalanus amphitrite TaxID=1232801 RepID=UPI001C90B5C0|nr:MTOR-associated protein MEAK7-like isoform X1 [Amphibalanus amphitrite]XP_043193321.1 MTOR-associated protein MEAK7-like isoform X1 [Amphibalanus amphitrite]XP_043193322.1 MTOR-associated protein MEAK7-like isoform X1 [Amphibalanus amphitrite]